MAGHRATPLVLLSAGLGEMGGGGQGAAKQRCGQRDRGAHDLTPVVVGATDHDDLEHSGQVPRDPRTGELTEGGVTEQSRRVLDNLLAVLESAGAGPQHVVSVTVYLADEQDWADFNEVYKTVFTAPYPTRTAVGAGLRGILVEVSAVAYVGDGAP